MSKQKTGTRHWLMKTEPDVFSIDDLRQKGVAPWDGVRNYSARNNLRAMQLGDPLLIYHSSTKPAGIAGLGTVARVAYPDHTSWDPKSDYYDAKSSPEKPLWSMVDVRWQETFNHFLTLDALREISELKGMILFERPRLSVQSVSPEHFRTIIRLAKG